MQSHSQKNAAHWTMHKTAQIDALKSSSLEDNCKRDQKALPRPTCQPACLAEPRKVCLLQLLLSAPRMMIAFEVHCLTARAPATGVSQIVCQDGVARSHSQWQFVDTALSDVHVSCHQGFGSEVRWPTTCEWKEGHRKALLNCQDKQSQQLKNCLRPFL